MFLNENGYLYLIDFSGSKKLDESEKTRSLVGTPHYIAPEVI